MVRSLTPRTKGGFLILAPAQGTNPSTFRKVENDTHRYDWWMAKMQYFRGAVYSRDGAVRASDLTPDGRHKSPVDENSWHLLALDSNDDVSACIRYLDETSAVGFDDLFVRNAALAQAPMLGPKFRRAVENEMQCAHRMGVHFGEVGGWAVAAERRGTFEAVRIVLATLGLLRLLGGAKGLATATFRHSSAPILRRMGMTSIIENGDELPPYFDPHYGCQMEVLRFDSRQPAAKYEGWMSGLTEQLRMAPVIRRQNVPSTAWGMPPAWQLRPDLRRAA
jgi:hypothetical protein